MKANGQIVYHLMEQSLTLNKLIDLEEQKAHGDLDMAIQEQLGQPTAWEDLEDDSELNTAILSLKQDDSGRAVEQKQDEEGIMSETSDTFNQYIGAEVMLTIGVIILTRKVLLHEQDRDGISVGTASKYLILSTRVYNVEFHNSEVGVYASNVITQNMNAQCDSKATSSYSLRQLSIIVPMAMQSRRPICTYTTVDDDCCIQPPRLVPVHSVEGWIDSLGASGQPQEVIPRQRG
jgi:hypothetical protein